jgi:hypothetical protein
MSFVQRKAEWLGRCCRRSKTGEPTPIMQWDQQLSAAMVIAGNKQ